MYEALNKACGNGQARELRRLLSGGAYVNDADGQGNTPLMTASAQGHVVSLHNLATAGPPRQLLRAKQKRPRARPLVRRRLLDRIESD